jgi:hypothetical protein
MTKPLPRITFKTAGDGFLHRGICVPYLNGVPIAPGVVVEQRCEIQAELEGLVRQNHTVWCISGLAAVRAISFGTFRDSNSMRGPFLRAVVTQFQWAPPMHINSNLWIERHVEPNEICQLGMRFTNWRARVVEPLDAAPLKDIETQWIAQQVSKTPNVVVINDLGHPSRAFYRYWEQELFGGGVNEDYIELTGHHKPDYPYRRKFIAGATLIAPVVQTICTSFQGLQAFSVQPGKEMQEFLDRHSGPVSGDKYFSGAVEVGDWIAFPLEQYGAMELGDCRLAVVCSEHFYLFNRALGVTLGSMGSYWALRLPLENA